MNDDVINALLKKAKGYEAKEVVEEYLVDEEQKVPVLNKKKITYKDVPPDISAVKTIVELFDGAEYKKMTKQDLEKERERLLEELLEKTIKKKS